MAAYTLLFNFLIVLAHQYLDRELSALDVPKAVGYAWPLELPKQTLYSRSGLIS